MELFSFSSRKSGFGWFEIPLVMEPTVLLGTSCTLTSFLKSSAMDLCCGRALSGESFFYFIFLFHGLVFTSAMQVDCDNFIRQLCDFLHYLKSAECTTCRL